MSKYRFINTVSNSGACWTPKPKVLFKSHVKHLGTRHPESCFRILYYVVLKGKIIKTPTSISKNIIQRFCNSKTLELSRYKAIIYLKMTAINHKHISKSQASLKDRDQQKEKEKKNWRTLSPWISSSKYFTKILFIRLSNAQHELQKIIDNWNMQIPSGNLFPFSTLHNAGRLGKPARYFNFILTHQRDLTRI